MLLGFAYFIGRQRRRGIHIRKSLFLKPTVVQRVSHNLILAHPPIAFAAACRLVHRFGIRSQGQELPATRAWLLPKGGFPAQPPDLPPRRNRGTSLCCASSSHRVGIAGRPRARPSGCPSGQAVSLRSALSGSCPSARGFCLAFLPPVGLSCTVDRHRERYLPRMSCTVDRHRERYLPRMSCTVGRHRARYLLRIPSGVGFNW